MRKQNSRKKNKTAILQVQKLKSLSFYVFCFFLFALHHITVILSRIRYCLIICCILFTKLAYFRSVLQSESPDTATVFFSFTLTFQDIYI